MSLGHPDPDFTITVRANLDSRRGLVAEGADGNPATEADFAHVRNWVRGMILTAEGALPPGWELDVRTHAETGAQRDAGIDPRRAVVREVPDRMAQIEVARCASCGGTLRREGPDAIWYHVPDCADPTPVTDLTVDVLERPDGHVLDVVERDGD